MLPPFPMSFLDLLSTRLYCKLLDLFLKAQKSGAGSDESQTWPLWSQEFLNAGIKEDCWELLSTRGTDVGSGDERQ